jgi:hypothetical protein
MNHSFAGKYFRDMHFSLKLHHRLISLSHSPHLIIYAFQIHGNTQAEATLMAAAK